MNGIEVGRATVVFTSLGGRIWNLAEIIDHVNAALKAGKDAGSLRYCDFKIIEASLSEGA